MDFKALPSHESVKQMDQVLTPTERAATLAIFAKSIEGTEITRYLTGRFTAIAELEEKVDKTYRYVLSGVARLDKCAEDANAKTTWFNHYKAFRAQVTESREVALLMGHHLSQFVEIVAPVIADANGAEDEPLLHSCPASR
ncbi:unnamed protein product [Rhizoctonia solani]|uniref:Uncharacterized protein n=1 Tax=Rhizoctonia solani TaxID=456999 RepID=A0A8H3A5V2_9AGAM|nr:unnamed protein product [Rhizoctonia solani]